MSSKTRTIECVEYFRGLACLAVLCFHANGAFWRDASPTNIDDLSARGLLTLTLGWGWLGVSFFFVLSGFCVHLPYAQGRNFAIQEYFVRRFFRIWPPYVAAVALGLVLGIAAGWDTLANLLSSACLHLVFWIWNLSPLSMRDSSLSPVFWSIVVEVQLYGFYAIAMYLGWIQRFRLGRLTVFFLAVGFIYTISLNSLALERLPNILNPRSFALARFGEWLLGALIAEYSFRSSNTQQNLLNDENYSKWLPLSLLISIIFLSRIPKIPESVFSVMFAVVLYWAIASENAASRRTVHEAFSYWKIVFKYVSDRSYSIYLLHFPCLTIAGEFAARVAGVSSENKDRLGGSWYWLAAIAGGIALSLVAAELCYRFVERPSHQFARQIGGSLRANRSVSIVR